MRHRLPSRITEANYKRDMHKRCMTHKGNPIYWISIILMVVFVFAGIH